MFAFAALIIALIILAVSVTYLIAVRPIVAQRAAQQRMLDGLSTRKGRHAASPRLIAAHRA